MRRPRLTSPVLDAEPAAPAPGGAGKRTARAARPSFAALRQPAPAGAYLGGGGALAMMADNIEHVITLLGGLAEVPLPRP